MLSLFRDYVGDDNPRVRAIRYGKDCIHNGLLAQWLGAIGVVAVRDVTVGAFWISLTVLSLGTVLLLVGCVRQARAKGYAATTGLALGLLSGPGAFALWLLVDRNGRDGARRGFAVMTPKRVSTTWVAPVEDDPRYRPRPWADAATLSQMWRQGRQ